MCRWLEIYLNCVHTENGEAYGAHKLNEKQCWLFGVSYYSENAIINLKDAQIDININK